MTSSPHAPKYFLLSNFMKPTIWLPLVVLTLCLLLGFAVVSDLVTSLPQTRPADFSIEYRWGFFVGSPETVFSLTATSCRLQHMGEQSRADTVCAITPEQLDELYNVVRDNRFDNIGLLKSEGHCGGGALGGTGAMPPVTEIRVMANGTTYTKIAGYCNNFYSGLGRFHEVENAVRRLMPQ
jgi:hypothetical protein